MELIPDRGPSPGQGRMSYRSEGLSEQPGQQPAGHNDRQEVDPTVFLEIPWINDDAFPDESLNNVEVPREGINPEGPESCAKMKGEVDVGFTMYSPDKESLTFLWSTMHENNLQIAVPMPMWTISKPVQTIRQFRAKKIIIFYAEFREVHICSMWWLTTFQSFIHHHVSCTSKYASD